jgi:hypothetical protein
MSDRDPAGLADELEREAKRLEQQSEKLKGDVAEAREDWERKRSDPRVPAAVEPTTSSDDEDERDRAEHDRAED